MVFVLCLVLLLLPQVGLTATLTVSPTGSGTACSSVSPCALQQALNTAVAGDTVLARDGTYPSQRDINVNNGTALNPITVKAENLHKAVIIGSGNDLDFNNVAFEINRAYWIIEGWELRNHLAAFYVDSGGHHATIRNNLIHTFSRYGVWLINTNTVLIQNNVIANCSCQSTDNSWAGVFFDANAHTNTVLSNIIYSVTNSKYIQIGGGFPTNGYQIFGSNNNDDNVIQGNVLMDGAKGTGLRFYSTVEVSNPAVPQSERNMIRDNIIAHGQGSGVALAENADDSTVLNNLFYGVFHSGSSAKGNNPGRNDFLHNTFILNAYSLIGFLLLVDNNAVGSLESIVRNNLHYSLVNNAQQRVARIIGSEAAQIDVSTHNLYWAPSVEGNWTSGITYDATDIHAAGSPPVFENAALGDFRLAAGSPGENAGSDGTDMGAIFGSVLRTDWAQHVVTLPTQENTTTGLTSTSFSTNANNRYQVFAYLPDTGYCQCSQTFTIEGQTSGAIHLQNDVVANGWVLDPPIRYMYLGTYANDGVLNVSWQNTNAASKILIREMPSPAQAYSMFFGAAPVPDTTSALEMHLTFNDAAGSTAQDSTANNHDGTLGSGATWGPAKMGASAVALDGTTNGTVTVSGELGTPAAVTLAAWVKPAAFPTENGEVLTIGNHVAIRVGAAQVEGFFFAGASWPRTTAFVTIGTTTWTHLAYTATAGEQRLYINGALAASSANAAPINWVGEGTNTYLGRHGAALTDVRFQGSIDDARVYSRVLTATDIAGLAALQDPPPLSILITSPTTSPAHSTTINLFTSLGGIASDNTGVTGVTWNCPTCTPTSGTATCTPACGGATTSTVWSVATVVLGVGTNPFTVTASDASGTAQDTLTVTYTPPSGGGGGAACTHYASPSGGGNGLSQGSPFQVVNFWAVATPGKVLCLLDGDGTAGKPAYTGGNNYITPPTSFAGTSAQPITIRALNDGKVLIDGGGTARPADLQGSWGVLEGVNLRNGPDNVLQVRGTDWVVRRVVAWDAGLSEMVVALNGFRNTLEDCVAFGNGRYTLAAGAGNSGTSHNIMRRCFSISHNSSGESLSTFVGYGQDGVTIENGIANWNNTSSVATNPSFEAFRTQNSRVMGFISYHLASDNNVPGTFRVHTNGGASPPFGERTLNFLAKHILTFVHPSNPKYGVVKGLAMEFDSAGDNNAIQDSIAISNSSSFVNVASSNVRTGTSVAAALAGSGFSTVWDALPGICKRYTSAPGASSSTLTTEGLWPWPMNQRILDAMAVAGRAPVNVTFTMQSLFGTIPASCQSGATVETCTPPRVGTPPTCTCPAGTVEPNCDPETPPVTCPPDCPVQDVFVIAPAGSSPPGNDTNACTLAAPCLTINRARSLMTPGDTLYLRAGTYGGTGNRITTSTGAFPAGNDWSTPTRIAAYGEEAVILQQATGTVVTLNNPATDRYLVLDRLTVDGATTGGNDTQGLVVSSGAHHIRFQNGTLRNCHFEALTISNANSVEILNTTVHGTSHAQGAAITGTSDGVLLDGVTLHTNAGHGLNASGTGLSNLTLRNTISRTNGGTGFFLGASNLLATNLLAYGNALGVRLTSVTVDGKLYNATVADNSGEEVQIDAGATGTLVTNTLAVGGIVDNGTGTVLTTNYTGDPNFVGGGNYRLASADSPAADAGTDLSAVFTTAIDGVTRPVGEAWDQGAYEREGAGGVLPTPGALSAAPCCGALHFLVP